MDGPSARPAERLIIAVFNFTASLFNHNLIKKSRLIKEPSKSPALKGYRD